MIQFKVYFNYQGIEVTNSLTMNILLEARLQIKIRNLYLLQHEEAGMIFNSIEGLRKKDFQQNLERIYILKNEKIWVKGIGSFL